MADCKSKLSDDLRDKAAAQGWHYRRFKEPRRLRAPRRLREFRSKALSCRPAIRSPHQGVVGPLRSRSDGEALEVKNRTRQNAK